MSIQIECDRCQYEFAVRDVEQNGDPMRRFRCPQCAETVMIVADAFAGEMPAPANDDLPVAPSRPIPPPWDDDVDLEIDIVLDGSLGFS